MNLLIISDGMVYHYNQEYYAQDTFLNFVPYLKKHFSSITVFTPVKDNVPRSNSYVKVHNGKGDSPFRIEKAYPYGHVLNFYKRLPVILFRNVSSLKKLVKEADVVLLRIPAMNAFLGALWAWLFRIPLVCYFVGDEASVVRNTNKYRGIQRSIALTMAKCHAYFYRKIAGISKVSFFLSKELEKTYYRKEHNAYFVFTSLIEERDIQIVRQPGPLSNQSATILYVGRLSHEKGLQYLIEAVKVLMSEKYGVKLILCGDGPERSKLQTLVDELNISEAVTFKGFVHWGDDLFSLYNKSDIFILPSLSEGIPKVLLEAMAKGLPIIATEVGGIPDIIQNGENGLLVPKCDATSIAGGVRQLMGNSSMRMKLIQNSQDFIKNNTAEKQAQKIAEAIHKHVIAKDSGQCSFS